MSKTLHMLERSIQDTWNDRYKTCRLTPVAGRKQFDVDDALRRAMHVFWRWGYSEASIDRLTEGTGLGRGSLYATFGDKSSLFRQSLQRYAQTYQPLYEQ